MKGSHGSRVISGTKKWCVLMGNRSGSGQGSGFPAEDVAGDGMQESRESIDNLCTAVLARLGLNKSQVQQILNGSRVSTLHVDSPTPLNQTHSDGSGVEEEGTKSAWKTPPRTTRKWT